jgi:hypothetical protein
MRRETPTPFREEDLAMRVESLRQTRDHLAEELHKVRLEIARHRPWSWAWFFLGLLILPAATVILIIRYL